MGSYTSTDRTQRVKAMAAVAVVHVALGAVILSGLNVTIVHRAVERMQMFDIALPKPPPPPPPPPPPEQRPKEREAAEGAPEKKPSPAPVVAPKPVVKLPVRSPVRTADVAGTGSASAAGAGGRGTGTGLGGTGSGTGVGDGRGFTPAQRIRKIPDSAYRRLKQVSGMRQGTVGISITVLTDGSVGNCRVVRSSGSRAADALMCQLARLHVRFRPARDPRGSPVASEVTWYPNWWL